MAEPLSTELTVSAAESLRALRRGLQRSAGQFALFFAVCDWAETRKELIRLLEESMPGVEFGRATLDAKSVDPLAEVLEQVRPEDDAPVMVLGLERAVPMGSEDAPILRVLNLERAEWPKGLRRPVVIWLPEALLGVLGRAAPNFLDWRSDTLHFPAEACHLDRELAAFDTSLWRGGLDQRMSEQDRRARVDELRSRLWSARPSDDLGVKQTRASWSFELGNHLLFLGEFDSAEEHYEKALAVSEELGDRTNMGAAYHQLGIVAEERGRYDEALEWYRKSLEILEEAGDRANMAVSYHQLGIVAQEGGRYEEALEWYRKSLEILEQLGDRPRMAASYHQLGNLSHLRGSYEDALKWYCKSLEIEEELGSRGGMAGSYHQLGRMAHRRGSYEEALEWYRKSLEISERLGYRVGTALTSSQIGILLAETGRPEGAVRWSLRALTIRLEVGMAETGVDIRSLRRERGALGEDRFRELVKELAESPESAAAVLEVVAEYGEPAQEVAEPPADYETGGRSDEEA